MLKKVIAGFIILIALIYSFTVVYSDAGGFIPISQICWHPQSGSTKSFSFTRAEKVYEELTRLNMERFRDYISDARYADYETVRLPRCLSNSRRGPFDMGDYSFEGEFTFYVAGKDDLRRIPSDGSMVFVTDCAGLIELSMLQSAYGSEISIANMEFIRLFNIECVPSKVIVNRGMYYVEGF